MAHTWVGRILVAFDQLSNAITGGSEDETISSRAYKASVQGKKWGCWLCKLLDKIEKDHCLKSVEWDEGK